MRHGYDNYATMTSTNWAGENDNVNVGEGRRSMIYFLMYTSETIRVIELRLEKKNKKPIY